jgi:hypothetical protein
MGPVFTPHQLDGLLAWYRADRGITQTNCARFVSVGSNFLSTSNASWLDGLSRLTIAVDVRLNDVTVRQAWVSRWGEGNAQFILGCQGEDNPGAIIFIVADGLSDPGGNFVSTKNNLVSTNDNVLQPGLPARIVAVFDSGDVTIYVNGEVSYIPPDSRKGTIPASLTSGSGADLTIGTDPLSSFIQDGLMSRLCIWAGTALTKDQVAADFNTWIGVDPASNEPVTPTHAWRLDEPSGTRRDCIGNFDLCDNSGTFSEAHITQVDDLSGNGFHARIRPINGPTLVDNGLGGKPTVRHSAGNWQFLICGLLSGPTKPPAWSLYALAMCTDTQPASHQTSQGLFNTFGVAGADHETWIVCVLSDHGSPGLPGSFGMGCGDSTDPTTNIYNQANSPAATYAANVWFQLTGIFPGGPTQVNTWFDGVSLTQKMTFIPGWQLCQCAGVAHPAVIGAATAEGTGTRGWAPYDNDFFDGQWADIAVCGADTTSQREAEETFQRNWFTET